MTELELEKIRLAHGNHKPPVEQSGRPEGCLLEWASYLAGEPWSDHPRCVSPVIAAFGRRWSDDLNDEDRQMLVPYLPKLLNTAGTKAHENRRAWMVTDWMVRVYLPAWLDLAKLTEQAETVRGLPELRNPSSTVSLQKSALQLLDDLIAVTA